MKSVQYRRGRAETESLDKDGLKLKRKSCTSEVQDEEVKSPRKLLHVENQKPLHNIKKKSGPQYMFQLRAFIKVQTVTYTF